MSGPEPLPPEAFAARYATALREYVCGAGEAALTRAYDLGREAESAGIGILELALLHHEALLGIPLAKESASEGEPAPLAMAGQFLAESLSPFEMSLRSYQENARLLGLGQDLAQENAEIDRSREQLRTILDATTAVIYLKDADGRFQFVNRRFQEMFGVGRDEAAGKLDEELLPAEVARMLREDDLLVLNVGAPREVEEILPVDDGPHTFLALKFPLLDASGAPYGLSCVATDITERKRAEEASQREREAAGRERRLSEALKARDQFLAIASHELKTPLTALELQVASLRRFTRTNPEAKVSDERVSSKYDIILRQVGRLTVLINDLIDVGRITSGKLELSRERVDLGELVRGVLGGMREAIERSGSQVIVSERVTVAGAWDPGPLRTVVMNVLANAVKFGAGQPIEIAVEAAGDLACLTIRDHGIGISAEDQQRIFGRFERAVSERHYGGFGIGLWIARHTVEAHGGRIRVRSERDAGSEFTIELPLRGGS